MIGERIGRINRKIAEGGVAIGTHISLCEPAVTEMLGLIGYDFVWIDWEHSAMDRSHIQGHLMAAQGVGAAAFVRVPWNDPVTVKPILEMGPDGVIFPMVMDAAEAAAAVASTTYPPAGRRGFGPRRANGYGMVPTAEYLREVEGSFWRIIQIEHEDAVRNLDAILAVEGVDTIVVGPNDLSGSVGLLGQTRHPRVLALLDEIAAKCVRAGKAFGTSIGFDAGVVAEWKGRGVSWIAAGGDTGYMMEAGRKTYGEMKGIFGS
ncbi:MAG: aldolase/citrate lyase family protein [Oscillospiraceae bacterium]|nr:aldolase/citrate lyase family protein [Oscillospiraceae bacterium]